MIFSGCIVEEGPEGPRGPAGPEGPQGPAGESAYVFEFEDINFTAPEYEVFLEYPDDFEGLNTDVALVYLLWGVEKINGVDTDIWRPLPQTVFTEEGQLIYNFDFTLTDVRLFLTANFSLDDLSAVDTDEWIARVVVVPGNFFSSGRIPAEMDYEELMKALKLEKLPVKPSKMERRK
jgi:hypothetical protein